MPGGVFDMQAIDYFAWFVLIVIVVSVVFVFVSLAMLPGKIAHKRNHPQADAINWAGWLGLLLTLGVVWAIAIIWANMKPVGDHALAAQNDELRNRIAELEAQIAAGGDNS
jgi:NADH:ubiquinone oxidoreductase subunit 6 (subunit J)